DQRFGHVPSADEAYRAARQHPAIILSLFEALQLGTC
ncbi:MAG: hypothetical protein K0S79_1376, partial [Nitrospira sp.]|nr:hypothetical protein [Nitrospira sp.]